MAINIDKVNARIQDIATTLAIKDSLFEDAVQEGWLAYLMAQKSGCGTQAMWNRVTTAIKKFHRNELNYAGHIARY